MNHSKRMGRLNTSEGISQPIPDVPSSQTTLLPASARFSAIVPVFNCKEHLQECFDSLVRAAEKYGNAEVIAVDNGSTDGSYELLRRMYPALTVLQYPHLTIAGIRNRGAQAATGEYLAFVDADCAIDPDYFAEALATFRCRSISATGSICDIAKSASWVERTWHTLNRHSGNGLVKYLNSGNLVVRRRVFDAVGGFNEQLTTGEDTDLGQRLRSSGFSIYENHRVHSIHLRNSKTLWQFFHRHVWHGQGLFIFSSGSYLNKPLLMVCSHVVLTVMGLCQLFVAHNGLAHGGFAMRLATLALASNLVPAVTYVYRSAMNHRLSSPLQGVALYHVYYAAKFYALLRLFWGIRKRTYHR